MAKLPESYNSNMHKVYNPFDFMNILFWIEKNTLGVNLWLNQLDWILMKIEEETSETVNDMDRPVPSSTVMRHILP